MLAIKRVRAMVSLKNTYKALIAVNCSLFFSGCVVHQPVAPGDPYYAPVLSTSSQAQPPANGSLYSPNSSIDLFSDRKALRVGDIITVVLQERTSSKKSSNIGVKKDNDISQGSSTVFGTTPGLGNLGLGLDVQGEREFKGEADSDQSNQLTGSITVTVVEVYPNGTLSIRGEKWMTLNRGDEFIRVSGLVRPDDVGPDNTVVSTKIANAHISYSGEGEFADSQKMGWLTQFFNGPIWPF